MEKTTFQKLAELFGFKVNADAIETLKTNEGMNYPDNWDEMDEDEQAAWKSEHMKGNSSDEDDEPEPKPAPKTVARNARRPASKPGQDPDYSNLLKLNSLIDEIGGFDAYKGLLLSAVEAVENFQAQHNQERDSLVAAIVANSAGEFEEADLADVPVPVLQKMSRTLSPAGHDVSVDYSMLNPRPLKTNKEDVAAMPDLLSIFQNKKED